MTDDDFPALFRGADSASNQYQRSYLTLISLEYTLLISASILSLSLFSGATFYAIFAGVFLIALAILLTRALWKPEQEWYRCRALAESVKTMTWRYVTRAEPFNAGTIEADREKFRDHLHELFQVNLRVAEKIDHKWSAGKQITHTMDDLRSVDVQSRLDNYRQNRILNQQAWYQRKAAANRIAAGRWIIAGVVAYIVAAGLSIARIRYPDFSFFPIDPIIVIASSLIGWMQIKKFNELSAAYNVTANEIGLIMPKSYSISTDKELSEFVSEAESAFSREHTMWIARQNS
ncbi:MAG: DUF4231 domain-containing protein [Proteobacteria bacterium]|nr:MAG: DUF4231 domain-containing protein [Pseudomonadota bacterium]